MGQLTNMPLWIQILSMGSFLFSSGMLLFHLPLAPVIICSFFYIYGAFGTDNTMAPFTLNNPWVWMWVPVGFVVGWIGCSFDSVYVLFSLFLVLVCGLGGFISFFPAFVKGCKLLYGLRASGWITWLWVACFIGGMAIGGMYLGPMGWDIEPLITLDVQHFNPQMPFLLKSGAIAILICVSSLSGLSLGNKPLGIVCGIISALLVIAIMTNAVYPGLPQFIRDKRQQSIHALVHAAEQGDTAQVRKLLAKGRSVNDCDEEGYTPLFRAVEGSHVETVQLLLQNGADVNARENSGETPLHQASKRGEVEVVQLLLQNGADVNRNYDGVTPLHTASLNGHVETVQLLLQKGADVNAQDNSGETPLHVASSEGNVKTVQLLLQNGADVNAHDNEGVTPLHQASRYRHVEIVQLLLQNGADANARDNKGATPLHVAIQWCYADGDRLLIVEALIKAGAEVNTKNQDGKTALALAREKGAMDIVEILKSAGAEE